MPTDLIVALVVVTAACLGLLLVLRSIKKAAGHVVVYEWERGLLYVDGRFDSVIPAGRYATWGLKERLIVRLPTGPQYEGVTGIDVTSADRLAFRMSATITYEIDDPRAAHESQYRTALRRIGEDSLIRAGAGRTLDNLLGDRSGLDAAVLSLAAEAPLIGCGIRAVNVTAIAMPPDLRRLYTETERARLEGRAALERARGEQAALRSLANAARMLKGNPDLMNLRLLQALSASGAKGAATLVLGRDALLPSAPSSAASEAQDEASAEP